MKNGKKEKTSRRSKVKHASLKPRFNSRIRQEYIDIDYIDDLDDTVADVKLPSGEMVTKREYMHRFMREWNNASVPKQSEPNKADLHRSAEEIKDCTDRNNRRNNDLYGQMKAQGKMMKQDYFHITNIIDDMESFNRNETEDILVELLSSSEDPDESDSDSD